MYNIYVPIKPCETAGSIHLFKITGMLKPENVKLNQNYIWDTIEIHWKEVNVTVNSNKMNPPKFVMIKLRDKFKIRCMMKREPFTLSHHAKIRIHMVHLDFQHSRNCTHQPRYFSRMNFNLRAPCSFVFHSFICALPKDMIDIEVTIQMVDGIHSYRGDRATSYSPCSRQVKLIPSLRKKIVEYKEKF